jgi:hypothetical protein
LILFFIEAFSRCIEVLEDDAFAEMFNWNKMLHKASSVLYLFEISDYKPTFSLFSPFCKRFSQVDPFWKDFKKWTLISAPWIMAPNLHASAPQIMAPKSWA